MTNESMAGFTSSQQVLGGKPMDIGSPQKILSPIQCDSFSPYCFPCSLMPEKYHVIIYLAFYSCFHETNQFSSVAQLCPTLCDPRNHSMPGLPVHHQLLKSTQTHGHWVGGAIQPSHPLSSPSPPAFNLSQHQALFQWVSYLHEVAKVLEFQLQHQSSSVHPGLISFRMDWLDLLVV